jgi:hypothetical protein
MRRHHLNPDDELRRLERAAAAGDPEAQSGWIREQVRRGYFTSGDPADRPARLPLSHFDDEWIARVVAPLGDRAIRWLDEEAALLRARGRDLDIFYWDLVRTEESDEYAAIMDVIRSHLGEFSFLREPRIPYGVDSDLVADRVHQALYAYVYARRPPPPRANPDERTRRLERAASQGDPDARTALVRDKLRSGRLILPNVALAAALGDPSALEVLATSDRTDFYDWIRRNDGRFLVALQDNFLSPATGYGKYMVLGAEFSVRAMAAMLGVLVRLGVVNPVLHDLPADALLWAEAPRGESSGLGVQISDRYLDLLGEMPHRNLRQMRGHGENVRESQSVEVVRGAGNEVANHLAHAISMSSGNNRTRWAWGFATDRASDARRAASRACRFSSDTFDQRKSCLREIEEAVRAETVPWLLGLQ